MAAGCYVRCPPVEGGSGEHEAENLQRHGKPRGVQIDAQRDQQQQEHSQHASTDEGSDNWTEDA